MPTATRSAPAPMRLTTRGKLVVGLLAAALVVALFFALKPDSKKDEIPSFDDPIGPLDTSKVPNGWGPAVAAAAKKAGIPGPVLAAQLEAESHWNPRAESPKGAQGLAQFTPDAWASHGSGDPFNPNDAIAAQGRLMGDLVKRAEASGIKQNRVELALAGYNAGFGNVTKYKGVPPFPETKGYLQTIAKRMGHYSEPVAAQPSGSSATH